MLPIVEKWDEIVQAIQKHPVIVVSGETGSGKTTQLPKICLAAGIQGRIGQTQPRRLAARSVADRIASELNCAVGGKVGYKVRFSDKTLPDTQIKIMTDGILLAEIHTDRYLREYDCIIIDEAHERSLNIDFILGYLKRLLPKRPDLKVIITSATIDVAKFSTFFANAPLIEIEGRTYPIEVHYLEEPELTDPALTIVEKVREACDQGPGDILIFQSGEREINDLIDLLKFEFKNLDLLPLYSRLNVREQQKIFQQSKNRKVIVATNVAETSITVPNVRFVIDNGLARINRYHYRSKLLRLPIESISQASCDQRKGRCGRVGPGICYRLYTQDDFLSRQPFTQPEILRTNLAGVILMMLSLGVRDIHRFPFIEPPDSRYIKDGFTLLQHLSAIDTQLRLTPEGRQLAILPIEPRFGRALIAANHYGALKEVIIIISALSIVDPREKIEHSEEKSDFMAFVNLWQFLQQTKRKLSHRQFRKLCGQNHLSFIRVCEWMDVHQQLTDTVKSLNFRINQIAADYSAIHKSLLTGFVDLIGLKGEKGDYTGARSIHFFIHPGSMLFKQTPKWIMTSEIVHTRKVYARMNAKIEPEWLEEVAGHLLKWQTLAPDFDSKQGRVLASQIGTLFGLEVVTKRRVNYEKYFPQEARAIFIQRGLVEEALQTGCGFYLKNKDFINYLRSQEERVRHQVHLVDEQLIYAFYDERLPENVASVQALEKWIKEVGGEQITFSQETICPIKVNDKIWQAYPEKLKVNDHLFPLEYKHDLRAPDDGVTLIAPVEALPFLRHKNFSWLIEGLLPEKIQFYLKKMRKLIRSPGSQQELIEHFLKKGNREQDLKQAFTEFFSLSPSLLDNVILPPYLVMHFKVVNDKNEVLASGDDINRDFAAFLHVETPEDSKRSTGWDFGDIPISTIVKRGQLPITLYPALVDEGEWVSIKLFDTPALAQENHENGLARLFLFHLRDQIRSAKKMMFATEKKFLAKAYAKWGTVDDLWEEVVFCAAKAIFALDVRTQVRFEEQLKNNTKHFILTVNQIVMILSDVLKRLSAIYDTLIRYEKDYRRAYSDISQQLEKLFPPHFIKTTPFYWLKRFPIYLQAISLRLTNLPRAPAKDLANLTEVVEVQKAYALKKDKSALKDFPWKVEELRVSLFAQALGTVEPVSKVRLVKFLESI